MNITRRPRQKWRREEAAEAAALAGGPEFNPIGKGTFTLLLLVPALDTLQFEAYYRRTNITGADDIFCL